MTWDVKLHDAFEAEFAALERAVQTELLAVAKLLKAAMRSAVASLKARPAGLEGLGPPPIRRTAAARSLQTSSKLLRTWRGRVHEVEVLDSGKRFRYRGQEFRTLSEVARFITGTHRSGPRFFGLTNRRRNNEEADE